MSITDGQIVLCEASGDALPTVDIARSLSRMGTRAYYPAIRDYGPKAREPLVFCTYHYLRPRVAPSGHCGASCRSQGLRLPQARLELSQVSDAERFVGAGMDAAQQRLCQRAELLQALLQQAPGERTGLGELACMLCALSNGRFDGCSAANVQVRRPSTAPLPPVVAAWPLCSVFRRLPDDPAAVHVAPAEFWASHCRCISALGAATKFPRSTITRSVPNASVRLTGDVARHVDRSARDCA